MTYKNGSIFTVSVDAAIPATAGLLVPFNAKNLLIKFMVIVGV